MAAKTVFTYLAIFCLLQYSCAEETTMQDAIQRAQDAIRNVVSSITSEMPHADTVVQQIQNQSQSLATKINDLVQQLHTQAQEHSGDLSTLFESVAQKWNETAANLQAEHPDATQRVEEMRTQLTNGFNTVVEEANKCCPAEGTPLRESNQMSDFMARRNLQRRDTASVEDVKSRSQQLKARMSSAIQNAESELQERSEDMSARLQDVIEKAIDAGTRMIVERMEAGAAENAQGQASQ